MALDDSSNAASDELGSLGSAHTPNFCHILDELGISLVVSTYQAGKLVFLRADGDAVNTHFRRFAQPMGIALDGDRLAVGGWQQVWHFHNLPAVAARLPPEGKHDACFVPRRSHCTGNIQIHEMSYGDDDLWIVNTRFSCLCTLDSVHSFVPRWRPPFVSELAPQDRCHLNGLCLVNGQPFCATALGATDTPGGWRANKKDGGIVIELASGEILARRLSMPHSPRWYDGRLWLLESGTGGFGFLDMNYSRYEQVARLPGFTRGLDFCGRYAFIGLSQVRETAVFSGIPITEGGIERLSGIWMVDIDTGNTVAFLKFEEAVQEIFAVQVLTGRRWPELINHDMARLADTFELPDVALDNVPEPIRFRVATRDEVRVAPPNGWVSSSP